MFFFLVSAKAGDHLVKIDLMGIKFRAINTDELGLFTYSHSAGTTHACSINHNGVQAGVCWDMIFLCGHRGELHHDGRANDDSLVA